MTERIIDTETGEITELPETQIAVRHEPLSPTQWEALVTEATWLVNSGFLPHAIRKPEQAVAVILQGRELGIGPMASFQCINIIDGKPSINGQLMLALVERSGQLESIELTDDGTAATCTVQRRGRAPHSETFSMRDAERLGLASKSNWRQQPATMRKWRVISAVLRVAFPDVLLGIYTGEELGDERPLEPPPLAGAYRMVPVEPSARVVQDGVIEGEIVGEEDTTPKEPMPPITGDLAFLND